MFWNMVALRRKHYHSNRNAISTRDEIFTQVENLEQM